MFHTISNLTKLLIFVSSSLFFLSPTADELFLLQPLALMHGQYLALRDVTVFPPSAGEDAADGALPGSHLLSPAVFWRRPVPADEWKETHLDLPRVRQEGCLWKSHYRRVS